jgi:hypothetical protein
MVIKLVDGGQHEAVETRGMRAGADGGRKQRKVEEGGGGDETATKR